MADLDIFLEELEGAHKYEDYIAACCPFHSESRPSFFVYKDNYRCLACGAYGRTENLLRRLSKTPEHRRPVLAPDQKVNNPFRLWETIYGSLYASLKAAHQFIKQRPSYYLLERGITHQTQVTLKLGYMDGWYTFPIRNANGGIIGGVARKDEDNPSQSKYIVPPGQNPNLFYCPSWEYVVRQPFLIVVFGIIDTVTLYQLGYASCSTLTGTRIDPKAFDGIRKRIYIIPDRKEERPALELASKMGWRGMMLKVNWPNNDKDINDLLQHNPKFLQQELSKLR